MTCTWRPRLPSALLLILQMLLCLQVIRRFLRGIHAPRVEPVSEERMDQRASLSVLLPVLNEYHRVAPCLEGLIKQGEEVAEILVIDGGSQDGTQDLVRTYMTRDARIRLIDAAPVPEDWNGKAWGLHIGLQESTTSTPWLLTIDADVRPHRLLARSLLAHAHRLGLRALSVATLQEVEHPVVALLHPALLTTLIYRYGPPGYQARSIGEVQANGQCFLLRREVLTPGQDFAATRFSLCEDVTLARLQVVAGQPVGFYEAGELVTTRMYEQGREVWENWTRSLPLRDHLSSPWWQSGWLEMILVQALPLPLCLALLARGRRWSGLLFCNTILVAVRIGVLFGTSRAYLNWPWTYWLSPLCDSPVVLKLLFSALRRRHSWRGRILWRRGNA